MIKKIFFCLCGSIILTQAVYGQIAKVKSLNEYQNITSYSDEFNGTTVNSSKWETFDRSNSRYIQGLVNPSNQTPTVLYPETYVNDACATVSGGTLKLTAKNETITVTNNGWFTTAPTKFFYQMGEVTSKAFFEHGYYEIRAKVPNVRNTNGMAFWFWDRDVSGVYSEIDVFETQPIYKYDYHASAHHATTSSQTYEYSNPSNCANLGTTTDITDGWHTYGLEWAPDALTYYIDGKVVTRYTQLNKFGGGTPITPASLREMRVIIWNSTNYGIEASTTGDVMEVDYFRYYKRKPSVYFSSYNATTGEYTYASKSNNPSDILTWTYGSDIKDVNSYNAFGIQYLKFKRVSPTGTISITANAHQNIRSQDNITQEITTSSTFTVGNDNTYFYMDDPVFFNGKNAVKAYAASPSPNGIWSIGLKNLFSGIVDWSTPQTQTGTSANFINLLSGKTYVIKHQEPAAGSYLVMTEVTKEITVSFNSEFYIDKVQSISPSSNTVQMLAHQASTNPDSEWHIWLINADGSVNTTVDQPQWGQTATFNNLTPGKTYQVSHGNYGVDQPWVSSTKFVPVDLESNFEFYNPNVVTNCAGHAPIICDLNGNGTYQLLACQKNYSNDNPSINATASQYYIYEMDANGDYNPAAPVSPIYGKIALFNVQLNKDYLIKYGVYSPNGYWTETKKTIRTYPRYVNCNDMAVAIMDWTSLSPAGTLEHDEAATDLMLAIDGDEEDKVQVFPNPTNGELYIKQANKTYEKASILDPLGRVVVNSFKLEREAVDISQLPTGTYILQLESSEKGMKQVKIVKQ